MKAEDHYHNDGAAFSYQIKPGGAGRKKAIKQRMHESGPFCMVCGHKGHAAPVFGRKESFSGYDTSDAKWWMVLCKSHRDQYELLESKASKLILLERWGMQEILDQAKTVCGIVSE